MFAGPNGSGKSTLKDELKQEWLGVYVNADEIEKKLNAEGFIDFSDFQISPASDELLNFLGKSELGDVAALLKPKVQVRFVEGKLYFDAVKINSYHASVLADFIRRKLVEQKISFSFETVMSHPDKIEFLKFAKANGFRTYTTRAFIAEITDGDTLKFEVNEIPHWVDEAVVQKFLT